MENEIQDVKISDRRIEPNENNVGCNMSIDISKYLSDDQMYDIAKTIYEEETRKFIKERISIMSSSGISLVNMVIKEVANKYADELAPQYHKRFLEICQYEIEKTESNREDYNDTVHYAFNTSLVSLASKYVNENKDELIGLMKDQINECAKTLSVEKISRLIATSVETEIKKFLSGNDNSDNK